MPNTADTDFTVPSKARTIAGRLKNKQARLMDNTIKRENSHIKTYKALQLVQPFECDLPQFYQNWYHQDSLTSGNSTEDSISSGSFTNLPPPAKIEIDLSTGILSVSETSVVNALNYNSIKSHMLPMEGQYQTTHGYGPASKERTSLDLRLKNINYLLISSTQTTRD